MADTITPELIREDGANRIKGTGAQNGVALAVVTVGTYAAWKLGLLETMEDLPIVVHDAIVLLLTVSASYITNRPRLKA